MLCPPAAAYVFLPPMHILPITDMAFGASMWLAMGVDSVPVWIVCRCGQYAGVDIVASFSERMSRSKGFEPGVRLTLLIYSLSDNLSMRTAVLFD